MAYKMTNSPLQMWPWGKKAKRRREQRRNIRNFREDTYVDPNTNKTRDRRDIKNEEEAEIIADKKFRADLTKYATTEQLEAMRDPNRLSNPKISDESSKYSL